MRRASCDFSGPATCSSASPSPRAAAMPGSCQVKLRARKSVAAIMLQRSAARVHSTRFSAASMSNTVAPIPSNAGLSTFSASLSPSALQKVPRLRPLSATRLEALPSAARRFLSVTERSRVVLVPVEEILYLKAELKYITIRTAEREFLLEESLTRLEEEFGSRLVRVHRNCLVARDAIRGFERCAGGEGDAHWEVQLKGVSETLPVSRRQQSIVREIGRENRHRGEGTTS